MSEEFEKAVSFLNANNISSLSSDDKLKFYAYFKQANVGICDQPKPSFFDFVGSAKWEAWKSLGEMTQEEAKSNYVSLVDKFVPTWRERSTTSGDSDHPPRQKGGGFGPIFSRMIEEDEYEKTNNEEEQEIWYWASKDDLSKLKETLQNQVKSDTNLQKKIINKQSEEDGTTPLHWACDRGSSVELVKYLLDMGANPRLPDNEGQTPLHYASVNDRESLVEFLLQYDTKLSEIQDNDGQLPSDLCESEQVKNLFKNSG